MEMGDTCGHQDVKYLLKLDQHFLKVFKTASDNEGRGHDWQQEDAKFEEACKSGYTGVQPRIGRQANSSMHMQQKQSERRLGRDKAFSGAPCGGVLPLGGLVTLLAARSSLRRRYMYLLRYHGLQQDNGAFIIGIPMNHSVSMKTRRKIP